MVWDWILKGIMRLLLQFKLAAAGIVGRILATFGLTMVTFQSILPSLKSYVLQYVNMLPGWALNFLGYLGLGIVMSMVFSALAVRLTWKVFILPKSVAENLQGLGQ